MTVVERLPYGILLLLSAFVSGGVAFGAYKSRRKVARAASFTMMAICSAVWMILVALDTLTTSLMWKEILWGLIPFALLNTLIGLFYFSLEFSLRLKHVPKTVLYTTVIITLILTAFSATNHFHHLVWTIAEVNGRFIQVFGNLYLIQLGFAYLLTLGSLTLLIRAYVLSKGALRRQTGLLLVGISIPVLVSMVTEVYGWNSQINVDETAFSIIFTVLFFGWATLRFNTFYLMPLASDVIIRNMQNGVIVTDIEGMIIFSNSSAQKIFKKKENQISGQAVGDILAEWLPDAFQAWDGKKVEAQLNLWKEDRYYRLEISPLEGSAGESIGNLLTLYNNTDQMNYEKRLNELAICDPLTGSYNRRYYYEMANAYFNQMLRSAKPLSILMIDLDHFKHINDTYGHIKGDLVLQQVAAICKSLVRAPDIFARYGGEEFILAMPETSLRNALVVGERLRKAIDALKNETDGIPVTASIGVVETIGETNLTLDILLNRADEAMYLSKRAGRNRVTAWKDEYSE